MKKIDITVTATIRPKLFQKTLFSFTTNMLINPEQCRMILNVDPIGEDKSPQIMIDVAKGFFKNVEYRISESPSFPNAVIWCWEQVQSDYVLHLEDDWKLTMPINLNNMINILDQDEDLVSLRLSKIGKPETISSSDKGGYIYYPKLSLNPTLFKGSFIKDIVKLMDPTLNPEKQLRRGKQTPRNKYLIKVLHAVYIADGLDLAVKDIGRGWMKGTNFAKETGFVNWRTK